MASFHHSWTALAQSELFPQILIKSKEKIELLLQLLKEQQRIAEYGMRTTIIRLDSTTYGYDAKGLNPSINEIANYCPDIVEINCFSAHVRLADFQNMTKLDKLSLYAGSIEPPSSLQAGQEPYTLPITYLSLEGVEILSPFGPTAPRSLRPSLDYPLLRQITSLSLDSQLASTDLTEVICSSTSLASLSLSLFLLKCLSIDSITRIQQHIITLRARQSGHAPDFSRAIVIIASSRVLEKLIPVGLTITPSQEEEPTWINMIEALKVACKKNKVELWRERCSTINGKVDLD